MTQTWLVVHMEDGELKHDAACGSAKGAEQMRADLQALPIGELFTYSVVGPVQVAR